MHFPKFAESKSKDPDTKLKEEKAGKQKQEAIINALKKIEGFYNNWDKFETQSRKIIKSILIFTNFN